jgi:IclR family transcriptional regulator, acetate operon repressor
VRKNQSVSKAFALIEATAERPNGVSVSELARSIEMPRVTAARLVATLIEHRLLHRRADDDRIILGPELVRLGRLADYGASLIAAAEEPLREILTSVGETVTLAVWRGRSLEVIYQLDSPHLITTNWLGRSFPLHASSAGKVFLAFVEEDDLERYLDGRLTKLTPKTIASRAALRRELARVRTQGFAESDSESEPDLVEVSVPVFPASGSDAEPAAIISVTGPAARLGPRRRRVAIDGLKAAATTIGRTF